MSLTMPYSLCSRSEPHKETLIRETHSTVWLKRHEPLWPRHMARHVRAVGPAVPYWDPVPVPIPIPSANLCVFCGTTITSQNAGVEPSSTRSNTLWMCVCNFEFYSLADSCDFLHWQRYLWLCQTRPFMALTRSTASLHHVRKRYIRLLTAWWFPVSLTCIIQDEETYEQDSAHKMFQDLGWLHRSDKEIITFWERAGYSWKRYRDLVRLLH